MVLRFPQAAATFAVLLLGFATLVVKVMVDAGWALYCAVAIGVCVSAPAAVAGTVVWHSFARVCLTFVTHSPRFLPRPR